MSEWRGAIHAGAIHRLPATAESSRLAAAVRELLCAELGDDPGLAQFRLAGPALLERLGAVRSALAGDPSFLEGARAVIASTGEDPARCAIDVPRLRAVLHRGHEIPEAAAVYAAHRDTWYANPQSQINWWIPLHAVTEEDSFALFPGLFETPLENNSEQFDYPDFIRKAGWQSAKGSSCAVYPSTRTPPESGAVRIACESGDLLVFSAAHLHQTRPHASGRTRFSIDFRTVSLDDHRCGRGAPNVDNRSTGSALDDYVFPVSVPASAREASRR